MPDSPTVCNSSCLIALETIGQLALLERLYAEVYIPAAVVSEWNSPAPGWVRLQAVTDQALVQLLRGELGAGEAEAIVLAKELAAARLILDDKKARRFAKQLGLPVVGTIAVVLAAKRNGFIPAVKPVLDSLTASGFWMSDQLLQEALRQAGE
jgi:predicted nucleic acid-binding protein